MRSIAGLCLLFWSTAPAAAQQISPTDVQIEPVSLTDIRPSSPSNATTTVSPTSVPQNMPELEKLGASTGGLMLSLGTLFARGDFGTDSDTSIWSTAIGARLRTGPVRFTASLPYLRIRSNAAIFTGIDSTPVLVAAGSGARRTIDGFGDLTLGANYVVQVSSAGPELDFSGRVKLDTATRSSGLSSGKKDYAVGLQITQPVGRLAPFASVTYRFLGDADLYRLRDGAAASVGASYMVGENSFVLASYHYAQRATDLVPDSHELFLGASTPLFRSRFRLTGFTTAGLSRGAPGVAGGLAVSRSF